jgi:YVTN family beta-propeller protein
VAGSDNASVAGPEAASPPRNRLTRGGVVVDFQAVPVGRRPGKDLVAGRMAEVRFTITEETTGKPVRGIAPGAWMDIGQVLQGRPEAEQKSCREKIGLYLRGAVGIRPMIDLNSYYVLVLNKDPSISVVDPLVSMVGRTSTLGTISLNSPGADWITDLDRNRVYVTTPGAGQVAVVDATEFKLTSTVDAGPNPTRVALQPDERRLWIGNDAGAPAESGVTVIDVDTLKPVARLATGAGHHEIAFSGDSRYAFVSNRGAGTVTVIDVRALKRVTDVATGPMPIAMAYSPLAEALFVADGETGTVSVLNGKTHEVAARITTKPGLGPMRFTSDGRWGLVVNPAGDAVYVLDAATNKLAHTVRVAGRPFQVVMSRAFAYVRALDSERVTMIHLDSLGKGGEPVSQTFAAGAAAPKQAGDLPLADTVATSRDEASVFVVNPADSTTYFYMEGMNAPSSNYKVYGAQARAVIVIERGLREVEPGVYAGKAKIPAAGRYDVAFLLESPQVLHCFAVEAKPDPLARPGLAGLAIEYLVRERTVPAGETVRIRFLLKDPATGNPRTGLAEVQVLSFRAPGRDRNVVRAREAGDGIYEADVAFTKPGGYNVHVSVPSMKIGYADLPFFSMAATGAGPPPGDRPPTGETQRP